MKFEEAVRALDCCARAVMALLHVYDRVTEERHKSLNRIYEFCDKVLSGFYTDLSLLTNDLEVLCDNESSISCWHIFENHPLEDTITAMIEILCEVNDEHLDWIELERNE